MTAVIALIFTKLGVVVVFGLGVAALNNLTFDGGVSEAIGRLLTGTLLMLIAAIVPVVAFKFFDFLGEESVQSLHAGSQAAIGRTKEVFGRMDPRRVAERMSGTGHGVGSSSPIRGGGDTTGAQSAPARQEATQPEWRSYGSRRGPSNPWKTDISSNGSKPGAGWSKPEQGEVWTSGVKTGGKPGAGWSKPAPGGGAAGGGAAAAGVAGAVVGAGMAAGQKAADTGSRAGAAANDQRSSSTRDPYVYRPWPGPHPDGDKPPKR